MSSKRKPPTTAVSRALADATGHSETEILSLLGLTAAAALLAAAVLELARAVDAVIEAWPMPVTRAHHH